MVVFKLGLNVMKNLFGKGLLPAVTLDDVDIAKRLAETYLQAGLDILEITFRTDATLAAIEAIAKTFPELKVGAGTILRPRQIKLAQNAGAKFGLSPGFNERVVRAARDNSFPFVPGVMTPSEIEKGLAAGCKILKLYPADIAGGVKYIKSLEGPYLQTGVSFIPMGGVNLHNLSEYLNCDSVIAAGGSWLASKEEISGEDFGRIGETVRDSLEVALGDS